MAVGEPASPTSSSALAPPHHPQALLHSHTQGRDLGTLLARQAVAVGQLLMVWAHAALAEEAAVRGRAARAAVLGGCGVPRRAMSSHFLTPNPLLTAILGLLTLIFFKFQTPCRTRSRKTRRPRRTAQTTAPPPAHARAPAPPAAGRGAPPPPPPARRRRRSPTSRRAAPRSAARSRRCSRRRRRRRTRRRPRQIRSRRGASGTI